MAPDVIIIGAGISGLTAALDLSRAGLYVEILEARERIGGRIFTQHDPALNRPIELGAEFVHGLAPEIWAPVQQHKLSITEVEGDLWCSHDGKLQPCNFFEKADKIHGAIASGQRAAKEILDTARSTRLGQNSCRSKLKRAQIPLCSSVAKMFFYAALAA